MTSGVYYDMCIVTAHLMAAFILLEGGFVMRKSFAIAIMLILIFVCTACREKEDDNQNFLGDMER